MTLFSRLFSRNKTKPNGQKLYEQALAAARRVEFYQSGGVPDTVDGRFDLLVIHVWLLIRRCNALQAQALGQEVFDAMFDDMDNALRELGTSDTAVGKRIKDMAKVFYGRVKMYHDTLEGNDLTSLEQALARNVFEAAEHPEVHSAPLAAYVQKAEQALGTQDVEALLHNGPCYPAFA